jgi:hypothetical protein
VGTPGGALVELFSVTQPAGAALTVPAGRGDPGWSAKMGTPSVHRFRNHAAPDAFSPVSTLLLKEGRALTVAARATGLALTAPQSSVAVRITTGTLRNCAIFVPATVRKDGAGLFYARDAPAPAIADCSNESLVAGLAVCGDGIISAPLEECEGTNLDRCFNPDLSCRPPGFSGACVCCVMDVAGIEPDSGVPCCNPFSINPPSFHSTQCLSTRCDPPFTCDPNVCQPDGNCCTPFGGTCHFVIPLVPCCAGLECRGCDPSTCDGYAIQCCVPDGDPCSNDGDCCSQHCGLLSGTCDPCRGGGGLCTNPFECCSLSCTSNLCDACAPSGVYCLSGATCCSGSCNAGLCD